MQLYRHLPPPGLFPSSQTETLYTLNNMPIRLYDLTDGWALVRWAPVGGGECPIVGGVQAKTGLNELDGTTGLRLCTSLYQAFVGG